MNQSNNYLITNLEQAAKILWENKKFDHAAEILNIATNYAPDADALNAILYNARMCYFQANRVPKALECLQRQLDENLPVNWTIYRDKANYLRYLNQYEQAEECLELIEDLDTKNLAKSWFLHKKGLYRLAFETAELSRNTYWWGKRKPLYLPLWNGEYSKKLVIFGESGSGDEIIFSRFINDIKPYCQELYYYTDSSLQQVICRNFNISPYDTSITDCAMIPAMSLSYLLKKENPSNTAYITANPELAYRYKKDGIRIGLCFHGDVDHYETNLRTLPEEQLVSALNGLGELVNLQHGYTSVNKALAHYNFNTWEETFALLDTCDFVVTCDTSIAHAAASLGKTVLVLMHAAAYFTWNHNYAIGKSDWYADAYCIKQTEPCQWQGSIEQAKKLIIELIRKKNNDA